MSVCNSCGMVSSQEQEWQLRCEENICGNKLLVVMKVIDAALFVNSLPIGTPRGERETAELKLWQVVDEYANSICICGVKFGGFQGIHTAECPAVGEKRK